MKLRRPARLPDGCDIMIELLDVDSAIVRSNAPDIRLRKIERLQRRCVSRTLHEDYIARIERDAAHQIQGLLCSCGYDKTPWFHRSATIDP